MKALTDLQKQRQEEFRRLVKLGLERGWLMAPPPDLQKQRQEEFRRLVKLGLERGWLMAPPPEVKDISRALRPPPRPIRSMIEFK